MKATAKKNNFGLCSFCVFSFKFFYMLIWFCLVYSSVWIDRFALANWKKKQLLSIFCYLKRRHIVIDRLIFDSLILFFQIEIDHLYCLLIF